MKRSIKKRLSFIKKIQGVCVQIALFNEYVLKPVILYVYGVLSVLKQIFLYTLT